MKLLLVIGLTWANLALAAAGSHQIKLLQDSRIDGKELKAGEYKMEILGDKIVLKRGKVQVEATAKVETSNSKYSTNSVLYKTDDGKSAIREIHLGGTKTKVVLN